MALSVEPTRALPTPAAAAGEQRLVVYGVSWKDYTILRAVLDVPGLRMTYLKGALELMSPSPRHQDKKKTIARLVECYALERNVVLYGYGNATFRKEAKERGLEPNDCWVVGRKLQEYPDIALEVVLTSSSLDKLAVYEGLGVREVWFWENDAFHLHVLESEGYRATAQSTLLPALDFDLLARCVRLDDQHEAVQAYRAALRNE